MSFSARLKLALVFILLATGYLLLANKPVFAETVDPQPSTNQPSASNPLNTNSDVPNNLHTATQVILIETMSAMICQLSGRDFINPAQRCLGTDPATGKIGFVENGNGMIGIMGTLIGYTFIPPASSTQYISYLKNSFGIAKPTYAQADIKTDDCVGLGFCGLSPVLNLWLIMRNLVYLIFIIIFIIIGVAIMFRVHIDPRTVMTIQNQIPKIIVGIVLVTFSFSIAGLLIDVMYVSSYLLGNVISQAKPLGDSTDECQNRSGIQIFEEIVKSESPVDAANKAYCGGAAGMAGDGARSVTEIVNSVFQGPSGEDVFLQKNLNTGGVVGDIFRTIIGMVIGALAIIILFIGVIFVLIRLWVIMIFAYINILLDIILAPFWFIIGLIPGSSLGISAWFRDMLANLAVYPATIAMLMLGNTFAHAFKENASKELFVPPLLGNPQNASAISGIIGLGFLFMLPSVLTIMKGVLKAPKIDLGPVFKPVGVGAGVVAGTPKKAFEMAERGRYAKSAKGRGERLFRLFGNPLYEPRGAGIPGVQLPAPDVKTPHKGASGPGSAAGEEH